MNGHRAVSLSGGVGLVLIVALLSGPLAGPAGAADFDGDGIADLAIGVPGEDIGDIASAGAVVTIYGTEAGGLSGAGDELWSQDDTSHDSAEAWDEFAKAIAVGDFNGDGHVDLAVGVPAEDLTVPLVDNAGAVHVLYGWSGGLDPLDDELWVQDSTYLHDPPEDDDVFGSAVASGDFDGDGYDDLAIGVPGESLDLGGGPISMAGIVHVLYGSSMGLIGDYTQRFYQDFLGGGQVAQTGDQFGYALAAGDFDGDGYDDLVIGAPMETLDDSDIFRGGVVHVLYGDHNGLAAGPSEVWQQDGTGDMNAEDEDQFGTVLATGDFDGDGYDDLAVGLPFEDIGTHPADVEDAGAVELIYGTADGLTSADRSLLDQSGLGTPEMNDTFGESLAAGDFNGDGYIDLAVGVPAQDGTVYDVGEVDVFLGWPYGLWKYLGQRWGQGASYGLEDEPESIDRFGDALAAGNFNGDGFDDLAVGVPLEDIGTIANAGAVNVIYGTAGGLYSGDNEFWHQGLASLQGAAEENDYFGSSLAAIPQLRYVIYLPLIHRGY